MNVTAAPLNAPVAANDVPPTFAGNRLGTLDLKNRLDKAIYAGRDAGLHDGYTTLGRAVAAMRKITSADGVGAAAVLEAAGRFYAQSVVVGTGDAATTLHLGALGERGYKLDHAALRAVVDGATVIAKPATAFSTLSS